MTQDKTQWSNEEIYHEVFHDIIRQICEDASNEVTLRNFKDALAKQDTTDLQDMLIEIQLSPLYNLMLFLDRAIGPSEWPGVELVNAQTREPLSNDYGMELASVIHESLYTVNEDQ